MSTKKYLYKFLIDGMKSKYDGSEWIVGKWRKVAPPKEKCIGLNASPLVQQALGYVHGTILAKVECAGEIIKGDDKWTCGRMRVVGVAPWTKRESVSLAVFAAELALPKWTAKYPDDDRPAKAIAAAKEWLETGKKPDVCAVAVAVAAAAAHAYAAAHAAYAAAADGYDAADAAAHAANDAAAASKQKIHDYALSLVKFGKELT